jgi:DNA-binding LacI/PurR family transcriptional regulator
VATEFLGAIVDELAPTGLALTLLTAYGKAGVVPARDVAMDGALVYSCDTASESREWLVRRKLPMVFIDQEPEPEISSVNVDDRGGARAAAQHLVDLGHRHVGIVNSAETTRVELVEDPLRDATAYPSLQRMLGWLDALSPAGIVPTVVQSPKLAPDGAGEIALPLLLEASPPPTAILCFSDVLALGVVLSARRLGLSVPGDLSVIGFDDTLAARLSDPPLTTVRQDVDAKGRTAAAALVSAIDAARLDKPATPEHHLLPTELVVRESTAPPPAESAGRRKAAPVTSARRAL